MNDLIVYLTKQKQRLLDKVDAIDNFMRFMQEEDEEVADITRPKKRQGRRPKAESTPGEVNLNKNGSPRKKRGRQKGSKNKPKTPNPEDETPAAMGPISTKPPAAKGSFFNPYPHPKQENQAQLRKPSVMVGNRVCNHVDEINRSYCKLSAETGKELCQYHRLDMERASK